MLAVRQGSCRKKAHADRQTGSDFQSVEVRVSGTWDTATGVHLQSRHPSFHGGKNEEGVLKRHRRVCLPRTADSAALCSWRPRGCGYAGLRPR